MASEQRTREKYQVSSGVEAIVNPNLQMSLDHLGIYRSSPQTEYNGTATTVRSDTELLVNAMSDESSNEDELAEALFAENCSHNPILGYYQGLYAGHVSVDDFRANGSSGGLATWVLVKLLENDLVDGVIHLKPSQESGSVLFQYSISTTTDEIKAGAKSRYYPGELSMVLTEALSTGKRYAITGIPSFITEVRLLSNLNPQIANGIKYYVGLICGHQKSTKYAEALAWQHGIKPGDLHAIDFRKKNPDGRASQYFTEMIGVKEGREVTITQPQSQLFVANWGHGFFKPPFSDFTDDAFNETADIALGDAWLPEYDSDGNGSNVAVVRNPILHSLIKQGLAAGELKLDELDEATMIKSQAGLVHHTRDEIGYRLHKPDSKGEWRPTKRIPASNDLPFLRKRIQDTREMISAKSHLVYQQAVERDDWFYFERRMRCYTRLYSLLYLAAALTQSPPRVTMKKIFRRISRQVRAIIPAL